MASLVIAQPRNAPTAFLWLRRVVTHPAVRHATTAWLMTRALLVGMSVVATLMPVGSVIRPGGVTAQRIAAQWTLWDGDWYAYIALHGYAARGNLPAFFPLLPALEWLAHALGPWWSPAMWGLALGQGLLWVALVGLIWLARDLLGDDTAPYVALALVAAPTAFFLTAAYADSLELACAVWACVAARRSAWGMAGACGVLAGLARPSGLCLCVPLLWWYLHAQRWDWHLQTLWRHRHWARQWLAELPPRIVTLRHVGVGLAVSFAPLVGLMGYMGYTWVVLRDPLAFLHAQAVFGRDGLRLDGLLVFGRELITTQPLSFAGWRLWWDAAPLLCVTGCLPVIFRRYGMGWGLLTLSVVVQIVLTPITRATFPDAYPSAGRYLLLAFPLAFVCAQWLRRSPWAFLTIVGGGMALQMVALTYLFHGGWLV